MGALAAVVVLSSMAPGVPAAAQPTAVPSAPQGLSVLAATHDSVTLSWAPPGDAGVTGYQVLRRDHAGGAFSTYAVIAEILGSTATTYVDSGVAASSSYSYRVKARSAAGLSAWSRHVRADTPQAPVAGIGAGSSTQKLDAAGDRAGTSLSQLPLSQRAPQPNSQSPRPQSQQPLQPQSLSPQQSHLQRSPGHGGVQGSPGSKQGDEQQGDEQHDDVQQGDSQQGDEQQGDGQHDDDKKDDDPVDPSAGSVRVTTRNPTAVRRRASPTPARRGPRRTRLLRMTPGRRPSRRPRRSSRWSASASGLHRRRGADSRTR